MKPDESFAALMFAFILTVTFFLGATVGLFIGFSIGLIV